MAEVTGRKALMSAIRPGWRDRLVLVLAALCVLAAPGVGRAASPEASVAGDSRPIVIGQSYALASRILGDVRRINVRAGPLWRSGAALSGDGAA